MRLGSEGSVGLIDSKACCILLSHTAVNNEHDAMRNLGSFDNEATDVDELFMDSRLAIELTAYWREACMPCSCIDAKV